MLWSIGAWRRLKGLLYFYIVYSGLRNLYCTARFVDIHILLGMGAIVLDKSVISWEKVSLKWIEKRIWPRKCDGVMGSYLKIRSTTRRCR